VVAGWSVSWIFCAGCNPGFATHWNVKTGSRAVQTRGTGNTVSLYGRNDVVSRAGFGAGATGASDASERFNDSVGDRFESGLFKGQRRLLGARQVEIQEGAVGAWAALGCW